MATQIETSIQKLYVAYFNRPADPAGLAYWNTVVTAKGGDTTAVSAAFAAEKEYKDEYAALTSAQKIAKCPVPSVHKRILQIDRASAVAIL